MNNTIIEFSKQLENTFTLQLSQLNELCRNRELELQQKEESLEKLKKELDNKQISVNIQNYVFTFDLGQTSDINLNNNIDKNSAVVPYYKVLSKVPGKISEICVKVGQNIKQGDPLLIIESMKMEATMFL